ncbi:MAG TPA: DNA internalization-related competence protein ComEC/Rec2 [Burkholderiales bacterium]
MRLFVLAFGCAVWALQRQSPLPAWWLVTLLVLVAITALALLVRNAPLRSRPLRQAAIVVAGAAFGFAWAAGLATMRMAEWLAPELEGRDVIVTGVVAGLPQTFERGVRFHFDVERAQIDDAPFPARLALAWYTGPSPDAAGEVAVRAGERWRLTVRLKRPHGGANPHGFDYEAWLLERGIGATGYIRPRGERTRLDDLVMQPRYLVERARERIRAKFEQALPDHRYAGVLVALAVGDQRAIESADWQLYVRTGVGHLMSISGLHVTMVAGLLAWLVHLLWRRSTRLMIALPARKAAALGGALAALAYCLLAGFAVPAQRTLYMLSVVALAIWLDRMQSSSRILCLALFVVLLLDPWAVMAPGFWLSFGAVALMLYVGVLRSETHWLTRWARVQWAISLGLAPLLLVLFQQVSLVAPLANAVAIPIVSLVVTPLALLAAVMPGPWLAQAAHAVLALLMNVLELFDRLPAAVWEQHAPPAWTLLPALLGVVWMLAPRGVPARFLGVVLLLPMYAIAPPRPAPGAVWLDMLDVGQGLAVVVRTRDHTLLYDAGPSWSVEADAGNRVVAPYLRAEGIRLLDALVVTHQDNDHAGGAASVLRAAAVPLLWSSLDATHPLLERVPARLPCRAGVAWEWDGVRFEMLHPRMSAYAKRTRANSRSCVLRIASAHGVAALLTGDIEAIDENALLADKAALAADVLLAPHHGSKTSSTAAFLDAVHARHVLIAVGYRNRFGHPHPEVLQRYAASGAQVWRTDLDGAVSIRLDSNEVVARGYRAQAPRYWR